MRLMTDKTAAPILIVDDDDHARALARKTLRAAGYRVVEAKNGKAAIDMLMADPASEPRLILLDLEMPIMPGWEFLAIAESYTRLSRIPVVIVSGTEPQPETLARRAVVAWVRKPCGPTELAAIVAKHARGDSG